jgi:hypothetical protein
VVTRGKAEIMKLISIKTMGLVQLEKLYVKIGLLDSQMLMIMEATMFTLYDNFDCRQHEAK